MDFSVQGIAEQTEIDLSYDTDGNRVRKTVYGAQGQVEKDSLYLVDRNNHTGYAQVVEEMNEEGVLVSRYHYGHDLVAADKTDLTTLSDPVLNPRAEYRRHYYHYDGLGSVRAISEENGDTTEEYDYDAYGILIDFRKRDSTSGQLTSLPIENFAQESTNRYLFTGEQFDTDLGMYYLRARYLNTQTGRFHNMDTYEGRTGEPQTLHKYLYAHSNPVSNIDPSGNFSLGEVSAAIGTSLRLASVGIRAVGIRVIGSTVRGLITGFRSLQITTSRIGSMLLQGGRFLGTAARYTRGIISAGFRGLNLARVAFIKFLRSAGYKKALKKLGKANHNLELSLSSSLVKTPESSLFGPKKIGRKLKLTVTRGGRPGRIFEIRYRIGKNSKPGLGDFMFRVDYWDYRPTPPEFGPHFHFGWEPHHNRRRHNAFR